MSEIEKVLKNVVLVGIGAAATVAEKGGELARSLVEKGEATLRQNQDAVDELKEKAKAACEDVKTGIENAMANIDLSRMTAEARAALRRQLDELDKACKAEDAETVSEVDEVTEAVETKEAVSYTADECCKDPKADSCCQSSDADPQ